jgi:hypothetical protein
MVDKLDLEVPQKLPFRRDFHKLWNGPDADQVFKKRSGGLYEVTADLRGVGIDAMLSCGHKHHKKLGPKLEILRAGDKTFSAWAEVHDQVFQGEAWDDEILRADLTADVRGVPVGYFERAMWCKFKHTTQQEYGEPGQHSESELREMAAAFSRFDAQTLYYGRKPRQVRFYDKTRHRLKVLLPAINRERKQHGLELVSFADVYGYDQREIVTRAERQMGARETAEAWGVVSLGEIHRLAKFDPFERLRFAADARGGPGLGELEGMRAAFIDLMRDRIERTGLEDARAWLRGKFTKPNSFRHFWADNEHLILSVRGSKVTRAELTQEYRRSLGLQLAA